MMIAIIHFYDICATFGLIIFLYNNDLFIDHIKYFLYRYDYELHNFVLLEQIIIIFFNNFVLLEQKSKYNNEEYAIYQKNK
jgi:hypothetical protein